MDERQPYEELEKRMRQLEADAVTGDLNLIETLPVGISITSPEGQVMHINAAGLRMFGIISLPEQWDRLTPVEDGHRSNQNGNRVFGMGRQAVRL
jgi:PAS domain-containing protein